MTRTIHVQTELAAPAERVWSAMKQPVTFLYVCKGLFGWPALNGRGDPMRAGEAGSGWLLVGHVLPLYRHHIEVRAVDEETHTIRTHEYGGILTRWDHSLHVDALGHSTCRYSDTVEIDAGRATRIVAAIAVAIYRYRQRRWHKLVAKHLTT